MYSVVIAEEDEDDFFLIRESFDHCPQKFDIQHMQDGKLLLEYLEENKDKLPHLIVLDINMPKKNGHEVIEELNLKDILKDTLLVVLSSSNNIIDMEKCEQAGIAEYWFKDDSLDIASKAMELLNK